MKKYLRVIVTTKGGDQFPNPLKLGEAHLISQLAQNNKSLTVELVKVPAAVYTALFG